MEELKVQRSQPLSNHLNGLKEAVNVVHHLREENERLQAQLRQAVENLNTKRESDEQGGIATQQLETPGMGAPNSSHNRDAKDKAGAQMPSEGPNIDTEGQSLAAAENLDSLDLSVPANAARFKGKYRKLSYRLQETRAAKELAIKKWKDKNEQVQKWMEYADGLQKQLAKSKASSPVEDDLPILPNRLDDASRQAGEAEHFGSGTTEGDPDQGNLNVTQGIPIVRDIKREESFDDPPLIVSSRVIRTQRSHGLPPTPIVKSEASPDSTPIGLARFSTFVSDENMDLDEHGPIGITPKKRRDADHSFAAVKQLRSEARHMEDETSTVVEQEYRHLVHDLGPEYEGHHDNRRNSTLPNRRDAVLQPRSSNKLILPRTSMEDYPRKRRRMEKELDGAFIFAEDGQKRQSSQQTEQKPWSGLGGVDLQRRLVGLLENPSPKRASLEPFQKSEVCTPTRSNAIKLLKDTSRTERIMNTHRAVPSGIEFRRLPGIAASTVMRARSAVGRQAPKTSPTKTLPITTEIDDPRNEPFRSRPLRKLALDHFKVNPAYNRGYDYAFSEVTRGKEQRRCLDGCTKPDCCGGKFRAAAEFLQEAKGTPTASQEEEDSQLLRDFIGQKHGEPLAMTTEEKAEVLLQAKTWQLAKKHSKHRTSYERRNSPPGFWRADFPDTQEHDEDRIEARKAERALIEERYREALKDNGKWLFRDE